MKSGAATFFEIRAAAMVAVLAAGWPVLRWYASRLGDGSDEPHGLAALAAALVFAPWRAWREPLSTRRRAVLAGMVLAGAALHPVAPALVRALWFTATLGVVAAPRGYGLAWGSLLALSLPWVATLQFYFGYPLRVLTAWLCGPLLALGGLTVRASGTTLAWAGERVVIDTPCSGLRMLWAGLVFSAVLACHHRLDTRAVLRLFRWTATLVFFANVLRAAAVFCLETRLWPNPVWAHETTGLVLFAAAGAGLLLVAERLGERGRA
jgi:exosortase/archaeosortase family protein